MIEGVVNYCMKTKIKFNGTFTELVTRIEEMGFEVNSKTQGKNMCVVRTENGGVVNWWKSTRTIQLQGNEQEKNKLQSTFFEGQDGIDSKVLETKEEEGGIPYVSVQGGGKIELISSKVEIPAPISSNLFEIELVVQTAVLSRIESIDWGAGSHPSKRAEVIRGKLRKAVFFVSLLNYVYWGGSSRYSSRNEFVAISAEILRKIIGQDYSGIVGLMIEGGVIERIDRYRVGSSLMRGFCKKYRINPSIANGPFKSFFICPSSRFGIRVKDAFDLGRTRPLESPSHELVRTNTFRLRLSDFGSVVRVLEDLGKVDDVFQAQMQNLRSLSKVSEVAGRNYSLFKTDNYGRIYSSFTNLFREARPFLRLDSEPLSCLDLHASHWFHAVMLWGDRNSPDFPVLIDSLTKGDFYQFLSDQIGWDSRDLAKQPSLKFLHSHPERMASDASQVSGVLTKIAPEFSEWLIREKLGAEIGGFKAFSWKLLREESSRIILDSVSALMTIDPDYPVITLHDALYVPVSRQEEALAVLRGVYEKAYGIVPRIGVEGPEQKIAPFMNPCQLWHEIESEAA